MQAEREEETHNDELNEVNLLPHWCDAMKEKGKKRGKIHKLLEVARENRVPVDFQKISSVPNGSIRKKLDSISKFAITLSFRSSFDKTPLVGWSVL